MVNIEEVHLGKAVLASVEKTSRAGIRGENTLEARADKFRRKAAYIEGVRICPRRKMSDLRW